MPSRFPDNRRAVHSFILHAQVRNPPQTTQLPWSLAWGLPCSLPVAQTVCRAAPRLAPHTHQLTWRLHHAAANQDRPRLKGPSDSQVCAPAVRRQMCRLTLGSPKDTHGQSESRTPPPHQRPPQTAQGRENIVLCCSVLKQSSHGQLGSNVNILVKMGCFKKLIFICYCL